MCAVNNKNNNNRNKTTATKKQQQQQLCKISILNFYSIPALYHIPLLSLSPLILSYLQLLAARAVAWHRQPTHCQRTLCGLQRSLRAEQKGHVGRAKGISGSASAPRVDCRQAAGEVQEGATGERWVSPNQQRLYEPVIPLAHTHTGTHTLAHPFTVEICHKKWT